MIILEHVTNDDYIRLYGIYDAHIGSKTCREQKIKSMVHRILHDPHAYWIGGGDLCDAISSSDIRYDPSILADWLIDRKKLNNIILEQADYAIAMLQPIAHKCLGLIEGNHEFQIMKRGNINMHDYICNRLHVKNLTDEAYIRIKIGPSRIKATFNVYAQHGTERGGSAPGYEKNKLAILMSQWEDADLILKGHTHNAEHVQKVIPYIPKTGALKSDLVIKYRHGINCGTYKMTRLIGASTWESRKGFQIKPMTTYMGILYSDGYIDVERVDV